MVTLMTIQKWCEILATERRKKVRRHCINKIAECVSICVCVIRMSYICKITIISVSQRKPCTHNYPSFSVGDR